MSDRGSIKLCVMYVVQLVWKIVLEFDLKVALWCLEDSCFKGAELENEYVLEDPQDYLIDCIYSNISKVVTENE